MEFNADKVAISTTGSEAIISGLWKLEDGFNKWNNTLNYAHLAIPKNLYSKNLYTHNKLSINRNKDELFEALEAMPKHTEGGKIYFTNTKHSKVNMYASHPPNNLRQENAKVPFVKCEIDSTSPWVLFSNNEKLQEDMTNLIYKQYFNKTPESYSTVKAFEQFISTENQGKQLLHEYQNTFENRFLDIPDLYNIDDTLLIEGSKEVNLKILKEELKTLMQPVKSLEALMEKANKIAAGTTKEKSFSFNGKTYTKKTLEDGYTSLINSREKLLTESFKAWDKQFCLYHLDLAKKKDKYGALINLYKQHQYLSDFYRTSVGIKNTIVNELNALQRQEVTENQIKRFGYRVNDLVYSLNSELNKFDDITFVSLPNIENIEELKLTLIEGKEIRKQIGNIFENGGFNLLFTKLENTIANCQRLDQKSVAAILQFHKSLH